VTEAALPRAIGELAFQSVEIYTDSRLGASATYMLSPSVVADVYLYDFGREISQDVESPEILEYFQGAYHDILRAADQGIYQDLQVKVSKYLHLPPTADQPFCLWAAFAFRQAPTAQFPAGEECISHLVLRPDRGYINKLRFTYPSNPTTEDQSFEQFLNFFRDWTAVVQNFGLLK
jgi:hypothetical protein